MDKKQSISNKATERGDTHESKPVAANPFENEQSVQEDVSEAKEALKKEQQFKEAQRERD